MDRRRNCRARPKPRPRWLLVGMLSLSLLWTMPELSAQVSGPNSPSPARVGQAVVAQGVAPMPAGEVAWRVVRDTAETPGGAAFEGRALGFALPAENAVLVTTQATGAQVLLAPGEAVFVADGATQKRESMAGAATPYFRIALVPAPNATDAGGDEMVFAGGPFAAPAGKRDISLVAERGLCTLRDSGRSITRTMGDGSGTQLLVLVTDGVLEVTPRGADPVRVEAGHALAALPPITIRSLLNIDRCSSYAVAVIGPEVP